MSRLKFAAKYVIWIEEQGDCGHFRNESMFNLFGCDGRRFVRPSPKVDIRLSALKAALNLEEVVR